jgi:molybdopterin converting factor small subunit
LSMMADLSTAVNEKYVDTNTVLKDRDTVAVMPPISGG